MKKDIQDLYQPANILGKYGWDVLGTGLSAAVAQHPTKPYVLKLFKSDIRYLKFIEFVEQNAGNKHLPHINKTVKKIPGTHLSYVRMERLNPITITDLQNTYYPEIMYLGLLAIKNDLMITSSIEDFIIHKLSAKHIYEPTLRKVNFNDVWYAYPNKPLASWIDISRKLVDFADSTGISMFDIHAGNFMLRNRTLVITDPF